MVDEASLPPSSGTAAIPLHSFSVRNARGYVSLLELSTADEPMHLVGTLTADAGDGACAGEQVRSGALVRWYVDYDAGGAKPVVVAQSFQCTYALAVDETASSPDYAEWWYTLVRSVRLAARVLRCVRDREPSLWAVSADGLSLQDLLVTPTGFKPPAFQPA